MDKRVYINMVYYTKIYTWRAMHQIMYSPNFY